MKNLLNAITRRLGGKRWERTSRLYLAEAKTYIPIIREKFAASWIETDTVPVGRGSAAYVVSASQLGQEPVVYSCGVGAEITFDLAMIENYGATVYAFDPTAESARYVELEPRPEHFHFQQVGIAGNDGTMEIQTIKPGHRFYRPATLLNLGRSSRARTAVPVRSLLALMSELGHTDIDVLKIDIEGSEYDVLQAWPNNWAPARQIVMEWHPGLWNLQAGLPMDAKDGWQVTIDSIQMLIDRGYRIFYLSERGTEMSFLRRPSAG